MKKRYASFVRALKEAVRSIKKIKPNDTYVFTINADYGQYQIVIGPRHPSGQRLEINGEIHHLFVTPKDIRPNPTKQQILENMKGTVVLRDLGVHFYDPAGDGQRLALEKSNAHPRDCINLAGEKGYRMIKTVQKKGRLTIAAYKIVQDDILKSLAHKGKT